MVADASHPLAHPLSSKDLVTRGARLRADLRDLASGLPLLVVAVGIALAWLLARTSAGSESARSVDTAIALAIVGAVPPVWLARLALGLTSRSATSGQQALGLRVQTMREPRRYAALVRLAMHPFGAVGWGWLAGVLALAHLYAAALVLAGLAIAIGVAGVVSFVLVLVTPSARALHDRVAGTALVNA
ncbi:MAG: hypothetical protein DWI58_02105 [Chloroflexi bacterium]|nr:MAG: hypothetical protein DWI58_02105 [Chloroflexota bacterium]